MNSKTVPVTGIMVAVIGTAHTALGAITWLSTGPAKTTENFWFTVFGVLAVAFGVAVGEVERARGYVPLPVLAALTAVGICGVAFMPLSGFLSLIIPLGFGSIAGCGSGRR